MKELCSLYPIYVKEICDYRNTVRSYSYSHYDVKFNIHAETILLSIYDSNKKKLYDPLEYWLAPLSLEIYYDRCTMKIDDLVKKHSLPVNYYIVLAIYGLRVFGSVKSRSNEEYVKRITKFYPILPDSVEKVGFDEDTQSIWEDVKQRIEFVMKIAKEYGYWSMLVDTPLSNIADDLMEASSRYNMGDYEGAVKFYRKVVEGIRNFLQGVSRIDGSENRAKALLDFTKKAFHLISNFGEHFGTSGGQEEAELARNITLDLLKYIITKIKQKRIELKQAQ